MSLLTPDDMEQRLFEKDDKILIYNSKYTKCVHEFFSVQLRDDSVLIWHIDLLFW